LKSKSGSAYWDVEDEYVVQYANHWTSQHGIHKIVDCYRTINITQQQKKEYLCGKCAYVEFRTTKKLNKRSNYKPRGFG
jgi:hypothetical protein